MAQTPSTEQTTPQRLAIDDTVVIEAPIDQVFQTWSDFIRFPELMSNVESVAPIENGRYHWVANFFGEQQEWDTELIAREEPRLLAWNSVTGAYNSGKLTFAPYAGGVSTEVRLHLDVTAPEGLAPQKFDKLANTARKKTHADLQRYRAQIRPLAHPDEATTGNTGLAMQLSVAAAGAAAGGVAAYIVDQRMKQSAVYRMARGQVALPANIASWTLLGSAAASIAGAAIYRQRTDMDNALLVGQWAPTLLAVSGLVRVLGHRGIQTDSNASIASWSLIGGAGGSILASITLHIMGRRKQGHFVGQWAPTLVGAALFARLIEHL